jgi:DNA-binding IclR family transcriptional regulator
LQEQPNYPIESVDRALSLLALFKTRHAIRLSDAAEALGVAKSTAHRLLAMLQHHGFVEQESTTRLYHVGRGLIDIGLAVTGSFDVRAAVRPYLDALVSELDETAHLVTLRGKDMVFLDGVESTKPLRAANRTGTSLPAHTTAGGKALLAHIHEPALQALFPDNRLSRRTPASLKNRKALLAELRVVRERGYAQNNGESESDIAAIACILRGRDGQAHVAISVSGPSKRIVSVGTARIVPALLRVTALAGASIM